MGFFIKSLNRRWSLYIVKENKSAYAMHANCVMQIVGHVMDYFANGCVTSFDVDFHHADYAPSRTHQCASPFDNLRTGLLAPCISTQVTRVDGNGGLTIPVILRTMLVQNCDVLSIKCTNFLHKALAGQRFHDLSITINSLALWNTSCMSESLNCG